MMTILYQFLKNRNCSNIFSDSRVAMFYYCTIEVKYYIITYWCPLKLPLSRARMCVCVFLINQG